MNTTKTRFLGVMALTVVAILGADVGLAAEKQRDRLSPFIASADKDTSKTFPTGKYTPFGYLDNPYHTAVLNQSGVIRSVPPLGFGFWARPLPWPYGGATFGFGLSRQRNYLSLLHLSLCVNGKILHRLTDFQEYDIELYSQYHTKNMMSYDFQVDGVQCSAMYFQVGEHSLICLLKIKNTSDTKKSITVHASNIYGDIYQGYWGCDGIVSLYNEPRDVAVSKFYADGDVFVLGADRRPQSYKATTEDKEWSQWIANNDLTSRKNSTTSLRIYRKDTEEGQTLGHMINVLSYTLDIDPGYAETLTLGLTRGLSEDRTVDRFEEAVNQAGLTLQKKILDDNRFYAQAPVLTGAWPQAWKNGLIYHLETIRMNIHPPIGIYRHHWDGMQIHTPRVVLGESAIDSMCLSYADMELAKDVLLGTFADALADNIPCSREDGSLSLVCGNGKETGTAPIWGMPFHVIHSIYLRDRDDAWIRQLYPHMKSYLEWWLEHRTDKEGWFHCACSWESGQDGSKRFRVGDVAASAESVGTVDIEAAMAHAIKSMVLFANITGKVEDVPFWEHMAEQRIQRTWDMFVDGRFRDFDVHTGEPIILKDYYSIMMLAPLSLGLATPQQMENSEAVFSYFQKNYRFWLEWPSFLFPFSEAAWNAGQRKLLGEILVTSGSGIFPGMDSRQPLYVEPKDAPGLSPQYSYRLPGVAAEWWPYLRRQEDGKPELWARGCENYGWGATFPTLLIRNLIGFRETDHLDRDVFRLSPALPSEFFKQGKTYGINNLKYRDTRMEVSYNLRANDRLNITLRCNHVSPTQVVVSNEAGEIKANSDGYSQSTTLKFPGNNYHVYTVTLQKIPSYGAPGDSD